MDVTALSKEGLLSLHDAIRKALAMDDKNKAAGQPTEFGVREHSDWVRWCNTLEKELRTRQAPFTPIDWGF